MNVILDIELRTIDNAYCREVPTSIRKTLSIFGLFLKRSFCDTCHNHKTHNANHVHHKNSRNICMQWTAKILIRCTWRITSASGVKSHSKFVNLFHVNTLKIFFWWILVQWILKKSFMDESSCSEYHVIIRRILVKSSRLLGEYFANTW